jgi:hypothetical protein
MYLLVFVFLVWSDVWVVVCALRALIVYLLRTVVLIKVLVGYTRSRMHNPTIKYYYLQLHLCNVELNHVDENI